MLLGLRIAGTSLLDGWAAARAAVCFTGFFLGILKLSSSAKAAQGLMWSPFENDCFF